MKPVKVLKRRTFGQLSKVWRADDQAERLIRKLAPYVETQAYILDRLNPGEDILPMLMEALYLAAYTWEPGGQTFRQWLHLKMRKPLWDMRARRERRSHKRTIEYLESLPPEVRSRI